MKTKTTIINAVTVVALMFFSNLSNAQNWRRGGNGFGGTPILGTNVAQTLTIRTGGTLAGNTRMFITDGGIGLGFGFIGLGNGFTAPTSRLHQHEPFKTFNYHQFTNDTTGAGGNDGFRIGIAANGNAEIRQEENMLMQFYTGGNSGVRERIRIGNGFAGNDTTIGNITKVSISHGGGNAPITNPIAMLNMGLNPATNPLLTGARNWMDVGTFMSFGSDNMYVGLKNETDASGAFDRQDAVINWGNNDPSNSTIGPDNLRFIFTEGFGASPNTAAQRNGIEAMRMTPAFNIAGTQQHIFTGIGGNVTNLYSTGVNPGTTLEINSPEATTRVGGSSGLRFTNLTTASPTTTVNPGAGVLAVDTNGNVIYVPASGGTGTVNTANNGSSIVGANTVVLGNDVGLTTAQLLSDRQIPMNNNNLFFTDPTSPTTGKNRIGLGTNNTINAKLRVVTTTDAFAGRFEGTAAGIIASANNGVQVQGVVGAANNGTAGNIGLRGQVVSSPISARNSGVVGEASGAGPSNNGVLGCATNATINHGVQGVATGPTTNFGGFFLANATAGNINIGVYGEATGTATTKFAGYFAGPIATNQPSLPSDINFKQNIDTIPNALQIISQLQPKTFYYKTSEYPQMHFSSQKQYGLIAQDVETILPELVTNITHPERRDSTGNIISPSVDYKGLSYTELIPLLLKGMQEQQTQIQSQHAQIVSQQEQINALTNAGSAKVQPNTQALLSQSVTLASSKAILYQNNPNPFNGSTSIGYYLADETANAEMIFFDMYGNEIKRVRLENKGNAKLDVNTQDLASGIYSYSLIADGKVVKTMQMMRSK